MVILKSSKKQKEGIKMTKTRFVMSNEKIKFKFNLNELKVEYMKTDELKCVYFLNQSDFLTSMGHFNHMKTKFEFMHLLEFLNNKQMQFIKMEPKKQIVGHCYYCDDEIFEGDTCYYIDNKYTCCKCVNDMKIKA